MTIKDNRMSKYNLAELMSLVNDYYLDVSPVTVLILILSPNRLQKFHIFPAGIWVGFLLRALTIKNVPKVQGIYLDLQRERSISLLSIPIYPLQRVFHTQNLSCTLKNEEMLHMLLYIGPQGVQKY